MQLTALRMPRRAELLKAVAAELAWSALPGDFVARFGGDEFAWIRLSLEAAKRLSKDFTARLERPLRVGQLHPPIGAAVGIALANRDITASALMAAADTRLFQRKHAARPYLSGRRRKRTGNRR